MADMATIKSSMKRVMAVAIALFVCLGVSLFVYANTARADIVSWTQYTNNGSSIEWMIDDDGVLTIRPVSGDRGILKYNSSDYTTITPPWYEQRESLASVEVQGTIELHSSLYKMFEGCSSLTSIDLSHFDTSNVTNMGEMFKGCSSLTSLDVSNFNTSNVKSMSSVFTNCSGLTSLDLSNFTTLNVTSMYGMFSGCSGLTSLNISGFNTSNVTNMEFMFQNCSRLTLLDVSGFDTTNVISMRGMFENCSSLTNLDVSRWNTSNVTNMSYMFYFCRGLASLDVSHFDTTKVYSMYQMFTSCSKIPVLDVSGWNTAKCTNMYGMFSGCSSVAVLDVSQFNTSKVTDMSQMFQNCTVASLDVSHFDTSKVTSMYDMFAGCTNVTTLNVSNWDVSHVTQMSRMFANCSSLTSLDLGSFNTSSITDMNYMFGGTSNLKSVTLGEMFTFNGNGTTYKTTLYSPTPNAQYTGRWMKEDNPDSVYTAVELAESYDGSTMAGTYVWELVPTTYTLNFVSGDIGTGSMEQVKPVAAEDYQLPPSGFFYPGKKVVRWDDGNGHTFSAGGIIPANTYTAGDSVTLTAVWEDMNKISEVAGGVYEVELQPGFSATIPNIPAGMSYRIYEQTEDGWVLVEQSNTSGVIQPLVTQIAKFKNQYNPEITSAMIYGMKLIDGEAASAGEYTFELWEGSEKKQTVQNQDGGAVVFAPLTYDDEGSHTYTVREVAGSDTDVVYDSHEETVTVVVEKDSNSKLTATITYDEDGIKFNNRHNPGNLRLTKDVEGQTSANANDEFEFKITLRNPNGEPVTDGVYIHYSE